MALRQLLAQKTTVRSLTSIMPFCKFLLDTLVDLQKLRSQYFRKRLIDLKVENSFSTTSKTVTRTKMLHLDDKYSLYMAIASCTIRVQFLTKFEMVNPVLQMMMNSNSTCFSVLLLRSKSVICAELCIGIHDVTFFNIHYTQGQGVSPARSESSFLENLVAMNGFTDK